MPRDERYDVRLAPDAERDLASIHRYLAEQRSVAFADSWRDSILELIANLEQFPLRGAIPKELDDIGYRRYRQILSAPYRIFYRVVGKAVVVGLIADGRRDMQSLLRQRLLSR